MRFEMPTYFDVGLSAPIRFSRTGFRTKSVRVGNGHSKENWALATSRNDPDGLEKDPDGHEKDPDGHEKRSYRDSRIFFWINRSCFENAG